MKRIPIAAFLLLAPSLVHAQQPLPPLVASGLDSMKAGHCETTFRNWGKAWSSPTDAGKMQSLISSCDVLSHLGALHGYEVVKSVEVGQRLLRIYVILLYENQPVYMLVVAYRPAADWKIIAVNWNTLSEKVFPAALLPAEHPGP